MERAIRPAALWDVVKDRLDDGAMTLSGVQQERLVIARAIAIEPEVLLLDEPASALVRARVLEMGGTVEEHLTTALDCLGDGDPGRAELAASNDYKVNTMEIARAGLLLRLPPLQSLPPVIQCPAVVPRRKRGILDPSDNKKTAYAAHAPETVPPRHPLRRHAPGCVQRAGADGFGRLSGRQDAPL